GLLRTISTSNIPASNAALRYSALAIGLCLGVEFMQRACRRANGFPLVRSSNVDYKSGASQAARMICADNPDSQGRIIVGANLVFALMLRHERIRANTRFAPTCAAPPVRMNL